MRGKVTYGKDYGLGDRITPAHAGKRTCEVPTICFRWDHPRACEEKCFCSPLYPPVCGSPPRMRGKELGAVLASRFSRITPAHAGKSC